MNDTPADALQDPLERPEQLGGPPPLTGRARSLANLRPPWTPEEARTKNLSGLTKRGTPASTAKLDAELERQLSRRRATKRLVETWIRDAIEDEDGSVRAKAREQILQRLYPVPQDVGNKRVVLEGLKLELTPGGGASVTLARTDAPALDAGVQGGESFVDQGVSESRVGGQQSLIPVSGEGCETVSTDAPVLTDSRNPREVEVLSRGSEGVGQGR